MPQMSPINWLMMFILSVTSFIMLNCLNYYSFLYLPPKKKKNKLFKINWKW